VNAEAVENLARQCNHSGAHLIQVSTDFVFDGENGPYRENARPNPLSFYGKSKQASENATRAAGVDRWSIARTVLVYGTGRNLSRSNFALWVIDNLSNGVPINVVTDQWRTPTYAADLAAGIERIARYGKSGVYHLSGRELLSIYEFAGIIAEVFDLDSSLIHPTDVGRFTQTALRPARTGFIILKAETELGYKPRPIKQALRHLGARLGLPVTAP
jgi:dTDP-4-dehydrorhamnose reductase